MTHSQSERVVVAQHDPKFWTWLLVRKPGEQIIGVLRPEGGSFGLYLKEMPVTSGERAAIHRITELLEQNPEEVYLSEGVK